MIIKLIMILLCTYILCKFCSLQLRYMIGDLVDMKPMNGVIDMLKEDIQQLYCQDIINTILYLISYIICIIISPIMLILMVMQIIRFNNYIKSETKEHIIKSIKQLDPAFFIDIYGKDIEV